MQIGTRTSNALEELKRFSYIIYNFKNGNMNDIKLEEILNNKYY